MLVPYRWIVSSGLSVLIVVLESAGRERRRLYMILYFLCNFVQRLCARGVIDSGHRGIFLDLKKQTGIFLKKFDTRELLVSAEYNPRAVS